MCKMLVKTPFEIVDRRSRNNTGILRHRVPKVNNAETKYISPQWCINGTAPGYLSADVRRVADVPGRKHLRSAASSSLAILATIPDVLQVVIAPSPSQPPLSGTSFPKKSDLPHHYLFSDVDWKLIFSTAFNSSKLIDFSLKTFITNVM